MIRKIIGWTGIIVFILAIVILVAYTLANQYSVSFIEGLLLSLAFWVIIISISLFLLKCIEWIMYK